MVRLIAKKNKQFRVSTIEAYGQRVSYTYKTLKLLQKEYPDDKFYFILGTDSFLTLEEWFKGKELLQEFAFIIGVRPGYKTSETEDTAKRLKQKLRCCTMKLWKYLRQRSRTTSDLGRV